VNDFSGKALNITPQLKGVTLEDKINNLINYFNEIERDERLSIALEGYEQMLIDLNESYPKLNALLRENFELQEEFVLQSEYLLDFNIKPTDILDIISNEILLNFCKDRGIKQRGNVIRNIIEAYKDADNLLLENYVSIGYRDYNKLKENGLNIKESEIGLKFEELTKMIFKNLGYNVDEDLRKKLNTKNDKIDIVLRLENDSIILIECKTIKESGYNKFSSVSRQLKSYYQLAMSKNCEVIKSLLIAPEFSDDFVNECGLEYELNLSLITAESLLKIYYAFKNSEKHNQLPYKLLMRDVLIQEERIIKAISK
jgi:ribosome-associated translation inhibitor RaiA